MTRYFAFCKGDLLLTKEGAIPSGESPSFPLKAWNVVTRLERETETSVVVRLDKPVLDASFQMIGLRKSFDVLSKEDYRLAGKCAELLYFDQNNRFCGCCGAPMDWSSEISKKCTNCGKELWPQLAPAVIVRVLRRLPGREEEILLVRALNFRGVHYGLVAGFLETGETLEEAVRRELWEETHIRVRNLRYFASQSWPYPAGLMVGFTAEYEAGEIQLQRSELCAGGWFTKGNLPEIPGKASIARQLIDDWVNEKQVLKG